MLLLTMSGFEFLLRTVFLITSLIYDLNDVTYCNFYFSYFLFMLLIYWSLEFPVYSESDFDDRNN